MAKINTMITKGLSGTKYRFDVYPMNQTFKPVGGVYVVTQRYKKGNGYTHKFIYVGETGDFSTRFDDHHKADCFTENNANCICTLVEHDEDSRLAIEDDLIKLHRPPCND